MLCGEMLDRAEALQLLSAARDAGINAWDTAEMYPVPQRAETQGASEELLGEWLRTQPRETQHVTTKVAGPGGMEWLRGGPVCLDGENITEALQGSLKRLGTDFVDVLLLHWPDRYVPMFGELAYDLNRAIPYTPFEDQLEAISTALEKGQIRGWGISNETAWGLTKWCAASQLLGVQRPEVLQNAFHLLCRTAESGLFEACHEEQVAFQAYSPLAMGLLTGKYSKAELRWKVGREQGDVTGWSGPKDGRLCQYRQRYAEAESRYGPKVNVAEASAAYKRIAECLRIPLLALSLRWLARHDSVSSIVLGASSASQLLEQMEALQQGPLDDESCAAIEAVHARYPNPCP